MSTPLVLLTGVVMFTGVLISWGDDDKHVMAGIQDRPREFFAFLFILAWGVFGVFVSLDLFMLFFFYEIAVFPMYLLIAIWGWAVDSRICRDEIDLVSVSLARSFHWSACWRCTGFNIKTQVCLPSTCLQMEKRWFLANIPEYLVPAGLPGLCGIGWHLALPQLVTGWTRCRTDSRLHVPCGRVDETGRVRRLARGHHAPAARRENMVMADHVLCGVAVVYGAYIAFVQTDLKYMIGFSSVSHMGLVMLGFSTLNREGLHRRGLADVLARCDDGSLLCRRRHDL